MTFRINEVVDTLRAWNHQSGDTYDLNAQPWQANGSFSSDAYKARYCRAKEERTSGGQVYAHPNVHNDAVLPTDTEVAAGTISQSVKDAYESLGFAPGEVPTAQDYEDMDIFIESATYLQQKPDGSFVEVFADYPVLWRIHIPYWLDAIDAGGGETPVPPEIPPIPDWMKPPYVSDHKQSLQMIPGIPRGIVANIESAWYGCDGDDALIEAATFEGILSGPDDPLAVALLEARGQTTPARTGLVIPLDIAVAAPQGQYNPVETTPEQAAQMQTIFDAYWNAVGAIEQAALQHPNRKYRWAAPGYQAPCRIEYSQFYLVIGTMLLHMSNAAFNFKGVGGRVMSNGKRDAFYVNPLIRWKDQDPWYAQAHPGGSGGIGIQG